MNNPSTATLSIGQWRVPMVELRDERGGYYRVSLGEWDKLNVAVDRQARALKNDPHDDDPHVGQCCNYAARAAYGDCKYCGRRRPGGMPAAPCRPGK